MLQRAHRWRRCNCHGNGIRLAVTTEAMDKPGAINFAIKVKAKSFIENAISSPCEFRTASYAWDFLGDNELYPDSTIMSIPANKQGIVHPLSFDPNGTQFRNTAETGEAAQCDPANAVTCGNLTVQRFVPKPRSGAALPTAALSQVVTLNEMLNFCFLNVLLGLNTDENVFITQEQVDTLAQTCSNTSELWDTSDVKQQCCMNFTIGDTTQSFIRRDLLLAAGCRSTAFSRNNGELRFGCVWGLG